MAVSVETVFYFIGKVKDLVCEIMDRVEQLKLSDTTYIKKSEGKLGIHRTNNQEN